MKSTRSIICGGGGWLMMAAATSAVVVSSFSLPAFVVVPSATTTAARRFLSNPNTIHIPTLLKDAGSAIAVPAAEATTSSTAFADTAATIASAVSTLRGQTVVVKYGGNAMTSPELKAGFCQDVATLQKLGVRVVVVHGGGPQISNMLNQLGVESEFKGGMRVSSAKVVEVAEMILCGSVNKEISSTICANGGRALGLSGRDDALLQCTKEPNTKEGYDLGFVGQVQIVNTKLLNELLDMGICPVISPIGVGIGEEGKNVVYNVNADVAAGRIAGELGAARVLFLTDISGVLDKNKQLLPKLTVNQVSGLIDDETITGGMIPKVSYATSAVKQGVQGAFITDGRVPHALLKEILAGGEGLGSGQGGTVVTL